MIKRSLLFALLWTASFIYSDETPYDQIVFGSEPSAIIDGCIHAITGDYFIDEDDWVVNGHEPIHIRRRYLSSEARTEKFGGWEFFFHHLIAKRVCTNIEDKPYTTSDGLEQIPHYYFNLYLPEKFGFSLVYGAEIPEYQLIRSNTYSIKEPYPKGLTNCFSGEIGARLNAFNNHVYSDQKNYHIIIVEAADGTKRAYESTAYYADYYENDYYLIWETLPNTNKIHYYWKKILDEKRLTAIVTTDASTHKHYARVNIDYQSSDGENLNAIKMTTSDGHTILYHLRHQKHGKKRFWLISHIEHSGKPNESYDYWGPRKVEECPLVDRIFQQGCRKHIHYYDIGQANIKKIKDKKFKRVRSIMLPLHPDATPQDPKLLTVLDLSYEPGRYEKLEGKTTVKDRYGNFTHYHYNKNFLLEKVSYGLKTGEIFLEQHFEWTPYDKTKGHWIKSQKTYDNQNQLFRTITYHYDSKGNVEREEIIGNLQGLYPNPNPSESYTISQSYNNHNLLTEEKFPNGKRMKYSYVPGTNLLKQKLTFDQTDLKIRHFYFYDGSFLKREIRDDGSSLDPYDLTGVTTRHISDYTPKTTPPFIDKPTIIEEKYYDFNSHQERLLSKQVIINFNKHGQPEKIAYYDASDTEHYTSELSYDHQGRLVHESDSIGRLKNLDYDSNDNLTLHQNPEDKHPTTFRYDLVGRPIEKERETRKTTYQYDYLHHLIEETDFRGNTTYFEPNRFGLVLKTTLPAIKSNESQVQTPEIYQTFNSLGKVFIHTDPEGNQTETYYTSRGAPFRIIHPDQSEELMTYDISGNLKTHTSPEGIKAEYTHDFLDRITSKKIFSKSDQLISEETWEYNAFNLIEKTDPDGVTTRYEYDGAGRKTKETTLSKITEYQYDELGRLFQTIQHIDENQRQITEKTYDLVGRLKKERELDQNGKEHSITTYTYDAFDHPIAHTKEVQAGDAVTITKYDSFDRIVSETNPFGHTTTIDYDDSYQNTLGQTVLKKTTTDPNGTQTIEIFDAHDHLSTLEIVNLQGQILLKEEFYSNLNGQKAKQVSTLFPSEQTIIKTWDYDSRGRLKTLRESPDTPHEKTTHFSYTPDGHLKQLTKPSNLIITYSHDGLGRITSIKTSDGSCHYELSYDDMGYIKHAKNCLTNQSTIRTYDHFGNLLTETTEHGLTTQRTYDTLGRKLALTLPDHSSIHYTYDAYHLTKVTRHSSTGQPLYSHTYDAYDKSHNLLAETYPHTLGSATYQIDLLSRPIQKHNSFHIEDLHSFDPNGNLLGYSRESSLPNEKHHYTYDALNQITEETGSFSHTYTCDAHYDRLQKDDNTYETNSHHELLGTDTTENAYTWDGHLATSSHTTYTYDGLDRLITLQTPEKTHHFHYDFFNRLLSQTINNYPPENYLYDSQNELGNYPQELRILGQGKGAEIGATLAIETQNKLYIPLHDLFGNIITLIDPHTNQTIESYRYSAFGEEKLFNSYNRPITTALIPWRFQSKRKIDTLIFYGRRFYNPEYGRWLSPDPKGFDEGPNLYQFNRNNPFVYLDLYGKEIAEFWRHLAGPDHFTLEPLERIEQQKLQWTAGLTAFGTYVGDFLDQARYEMYSFGSPTLTNLPEQTLISTFLENKVHEVFPWDRNDPVYQMAVTTARLGLDINTLFFGGIIAESFASKRAMDTRELCLQTIDFLERPVYRSGITFSEKSLSNLKEKHIAEIIERIEKFLGKGSKGFLNEAGDVIIESKDGLKQFRIDLLHTHPHQNPHSHIIEYEKIKNKKYKSFDHRIYPSDVKPG
ncbi:RHS repeat-associated core domain-containing protein [Simkania negevensis]|nr:RHS repeat-associated core domain-containing protein [Simkania negevensis]